MQIELCVSCVREGQPGRWPLTDVRASMVGAPPCIGPELETWATFRLADREHIPRVGTRVKTRALPRGRPPLKVEYAEIDVDDRRIRLWTGELRSKTAEEHAALVEAFRNAGWLMVDRPARPSASDQSD